ncbi:MAG: enoyl-CoA hydratase/isomerase family protein [Desulfobacteraceae bacterium]|nr:enoyl-CoA hydratase/isomerase family protein [Desulfobacteraceae bacterium]MBC2756703.1 enoyl-CoA hydratase/isomerase family protein [Desulfobacteraceae bacterium]
MTYNNILFEINDNIATVTINRPKSLNALNTEVLNEIFQTVESVAANEEIRVLILTGSGEKAFVAGADITELAELNTLQAKFFVANGHKTMAALQDLAIPVIAAVNGFALGGGLELALSCDFIYASENAKFGLPEITLGLIPGFGGTQRLSRIIGKNMAKEMIFTGKMISAQEASQMGFVNLVVPAEKLMESVTKTARAIASKGKVSLNMAKQTINQGLDVDLQTGCKTEIDAFALCVASEDAQEGTRAFLEKRKPDFRGNLKG